MEIKIIRTYFDKTLQRRVEKGEVLEDIDGERAKTLELSRVAIISDTDKKSANKNKSSKNKKEPGADDPKSESENEEIDNQKKD